MGSRQGEVSNDARNVAGDARVVPVRIRVEIPSSLFRTSHISNIRILYTLTVMDVNRIR